MAYQIDRFNRTPLTTVEDGTLDETTDIKFVGKNYAGYGEIHNENFLFLLENFAGANEPPKPISGQVWYDSSSDKMKFRDSNSSWRTIGGSETSPTQPVGLATGDFWWDTGNDQLYVYNGTEFILVGPQGAGDNVTQMVSKTILDTIDVARPVIISTVNNIAISVYSPTEFTIKNVAGNTIEGFGKIYQGVTLRDTDNDTGETSTAYRFHGTATDADRLQGLDANSFIRSGNPSFDQQIIAPAAGLIADGVFSFYVEAGSGGAQDFGVIKNASGPSNSIKFITKNASSNETHMASFTSNGLMPSSTGTFDLGSTNLKWNQIHADELKGTADKALELRVGTTGSQFTYATDSSTSSTVAVRTSDNRILADVFEGVATSARFADLAEKYTTDKDHPVGTVMCVAADPSFEITNCMLDSFPVGVISEKPAYLMNSESAGQAIALEGRVPVRIIGEVKKGQVVYVDADGTASTRYNGNPRIGVALESNLDTNEKLVECILKL
jgi:hypothetical protein